MHDTLLGLKAEASPFICSAFNVEAAAIPPLPEGSGFLAEECEKAGRQLRGRRDRPASPAGQNRRAQFSLELLLVMAAYFALLATFIAAENKAGRELAAAEKAFSNRTQA
ncbi:MAG: hypothetical protein NTY90_03220, partial [Candidatus Micrarchaeota archaeon]|nr:hypothetical protein [Candidatus Micrarchaeota archaeon]